MSEDYTQHQSIGEQLEAERLSLQATAPPSRVPGYRLERFLGAGAFGQVWVGVDLNTMRPVAIKFYLHRGGVNWSLLSREVKNLVHLSADRYVVQVLEVGWDGDPPYYVMEYLPRGSLEDLLKERERISVKQAVDIFRRICVGLNHCHEKGILHCDLKPANILLDQEYEPRIADFGQSRMSQDQTPALGTLFYMAPEQADMESVPDVHWDVYGLGAILYRMLTGNAPYRDDRLVQKLDSASSLPERLQQYRDSIYTSKKPRQHQGIRGVDRTLAQIVDRCIAPHPEDRYANVQQVVEALDRRAAGQLRRPLMLLGIVGPLLLLAATCIYAARSMRQTRRSAETALRAASLQSNRLGAQFAARTMEGELQGYFNLVQNESEHSKVQESLREVLEDPILSELRNKVISGDTASVRDRFLDHPIRCRLDEIMQKRLKNYLPNDDGKSLLPRLASMFVTDAQGTILGIAYDQPVSRKSYSAGRNYAYRTYFHGGRADLPPGERKSIEPLSRTHLSAAFKSTATGAWKIAVSTPLYLSEDVSSPDGVLVVTTNLGEFELLRSADHRDHIAVLVDTRAGDLYGTILQHPSLNQQTLAGSSRMGKRFQLPATTLNEMLRGGDVDYIDPLSSDEEENEYSGTWLAAVHPVAVPRTHLAAFEQPTDLLVLVQYRLSDVLVPVEELIDRMFREGAVAVASFLLIMLILWFFVVRARSNLTDRQEPKKDLPKNEEAEVVTIQQ